MEGFSRSLFATILAGPEKGNSSSDKILTAWLSVEAIGYECRFNRKISWIEKSAFF